MNIHVFGAFVHGMLVFGHSLGVVYNLRRKNWIQAGIHTATMGYDLWAVNHHMNQLEKDHGVHDPSGGSRTAPSPHEQ